MLLPKEGVIYTYVIENSDLKKVTNFFSFYSLPSSILKKTGHSYDKVNVSINK